MHGISGVETLEIRIEALPPKLIRYRDWWDSDLSSLAL